MSLPVTLIVDDPAPLINVYWWHAAESQATDRPTQASGEPVAREIPVDFLRQFVDVIANRGIKAGNVPLMPGSPIAPEVEGLDNPVIIGLTTTPERLIQVRRNRLRSMNHDQETDYVDLAMVREEVLAARRLFAKHSWPIIDVTRRSIEEVAAEILQYIAHRHGGEVVFSTRVGGRHGGGNA